MNVPKVDIKQLLEAGVHLGHKTLRWNPKMKKYIFGEKNSIHIIDLTQTVDFLKNALVQVHKVIASGGKLLVVSTKKQASEQVSELAKETGIDADLVVPVPDSGNAAALGYAQEKKVKFDLLLGVGGFSLHISWT